MATDNLESLRPTAEIYGALLNGLVRSFRNINLIAAEKAAKLGSDIEHETWYPMQRFFDLLALLTKGKKDLSPILFRAGKLFIEEWYYQGPGQDLISTAIDFLEFQANSGGYKSVVRGAPEYVGYIELLELDINKGIAILEAATPFPREFERGVFYGGMLVPGDIEWLTVNSIESPYYGQLTKKILTIRYRKRPEKDIDAEIECITESMQPGDNLQLSSIIGEELAWKYKALKHRYGIEHNIWESTNRLLDDAVQRLYEASQELSHLASIDELTGLNNRRQILSIAEIEHNRIARTREPLSILIVDIDHFKSINDTYGHATGDDVLRDVAKLLHSSIRRTDHIGRIGGEEFLILFPNTSKENAGTIAEKIRHNVENLEMEFAKTRISVTVSIGVTTINTHSDTFDCHIEGADKALYQSKQRGRNRVTQLSSHETGN